MKVLVVQGHLLLAEAISSVLENAEVDVVGVATTGRNALEALPRATPDVLLLDLALPDMCGLEVGRRALQMRPVVKILILAPEENPRETAKNVLQAGFHGLLPTQVSTARLIESLRRVCSGQTIPPPHVTAAVRSERRSHEHERALLMSQLTNREREVLCLLATGASSKEIASHLTITANTVRSHVQNLLAKLGVNNRLKAVLLASAHGLLVGSDDKVIAD
ncbi:MAG: LuxR C-terminal-related transcriptional regulator [Egibacteraceae bacterium]